MNRRALCRAVLAIGLLLIVLFIYGNSAQISDSSSALSLEITELLNRGLTWLGFSRRFPHALVRKLAHFCEYALLGLWLTLGLRTFTRRMTAHISWPLLIGLLVAVTDELLQMSIPGRGSSVRDVVIDFGGVLAGVTVGVVLLAMFGGMERKPSRE